MIEAIIDKCRGKVGIISKEHSGWLNQPIRFYSSINLRQEMDEHRIRTYGEVSVFVETENVNYYS